MRLAVLLLATGLSGCSILSLSSTAITGSNPSAAATLASSRFFAIVLHNVGENGAVDIGNLTAIAGSLYDVVALDETSTESSATKLPEAATLDELHATSGATGLKKILLADLDVGEAESNRTYWQSSWGIGSPSFILGADPNGFPNVYAVNFTDPRWQNVVFGTSTSLVDQAIADGFDGALLDNVGAYAQPIVQNADHNALTDMVTFLAAISAYAKAKEPGFLIVANGAAPLTGDSRLLAALDGDAEEALFFGSSPTQLGDVPQDPGTRAATLTLLQRIQSANKPVFSIDFAVQPLNVSLAYGGGAANHLIEYVTTRDLAELTTTPPPGLTSSSAVRQVR